MSERVTSLVEVWIEIAYNDLKVFGDKSSLPLWKCGLKYGSANPPFELAMSLPLWKCGLKF